MALLEKFLFEKIKSSLFIVIKILVFNDKTFSIILKKIALKKFVFEVNLKP